MAEPLIRFEKGLLTMRMMDVLRAGPMPAAGDGPAPFWASLRDRLRRRLNRHAIRRLDGFTDHELADIGLTRLDVQSALSGARFFDDPSRDLARIARGRRQS